MCSGSMILICILYNIIIIIDDVCEPEKSGNFHLKCCVRSTTYSTSKYGAYIILIDIVCIPTSLSFKNFFYSCKHVAYT